ncbi:MAG TPA: hypothetical protein IAB06_06155 [Candidatus Avacidaminococcus intestinavium]|uniref:Uncharacterized protein n=1 Tax=Candidatus Avacidaminococcus intestinavium TaxID=2840684 RepID=A0A9D1SM18_9FIRM|nr:hypothetical protein [Candidatus Avacidaminococcus intestinavium]
MSNDILSSVSGNKMAQLRQEVKDLRELLKKTDDPDKIAAIKKEIMEKETHYNILADRARLQ